MKNGDKFNLMTWYCIVAAQLPLVFCLFLPDTPVYDWHYKIFKFITQDLKITIGFNGPLPLYTPIVSIYITLLVSVIGFYLIFKFIKQYGIGKCYQERIYDQVMYFIDAKYTRWLVNYPLLRKIYIYSIHLLFIGISIWHFSDDNISFVRSRKGSLIALGYQYRLGVIVWEYMFQFLLIGNLICMIFYSIYTLNILRGLGWGNTHDLTHSTLMTKKQNNRRRKRKAKNDHLKNNE